MAPEIEDAVKRCRDCNVLFTVQAEHVEWYQKKGLFLPARCQKCLDKRKKRKKAPKPKSDETSEFIDPTPRMTSVSFDADLLQLLQDAAETFNAELKELISKPLQGLTTFKDLDRLFTSGAELVMSLKLNSFLCAEEEEDQAEKEELLPDNRPMAEQLRDAGLKVEGTSPQKTEDPTEVTEPSEKTAQASQ